MKLLVDSSVIVKLDRKDQETQVLLKKFSQEHQLFISTITLAEILTGSYLRDDYEFASRKAKSILGRFSWIELDAMIAEKVGEINAYLISNGQKIEFPDVIIAGTFSKIQADYLLTFNKQHFERIGFLAKFTLTPQELDAQIGKQRI
jgi:predicted nucleic acid-binding protein